MLGPQGIFSPVSIPAPDSKIALLNWRFEMTPAEDEELSRLCKIVATEKDPDKFDEAVRQLNDLLSAKYSRIHLVKTKIE